MKVHVILKLQPTTIKKKRKKLHKTSHQVLQNNKAMKSPSKDEFAKLGGRAVYVMQRVS